MCLALVQAAYDPAVVSELVRSVVCLSPLVCESTRHQLFGALHIVLSLSMQVFICSFRAYRLTEGVLLRSTTWCARPLLGSTP